ncbi:MAG TPA: hypothetical protein VN903_29240 [Polyangia bacterium]|nr:hypothetical protein [Polyangia bacterium]
MQLAVAKPIWLATGRTALTTIESSAVDVPPAVAEALLVIGLISINGAPANLDNVSVLVERSRDGEWEELLTFTPEPDTFRLLHRVGIPTDTLGTAARVTIQNPDGVLLDQTVLLFVPERHATHGGLAAPAGVDELEVPTDITGGGSGIPPRIFALGQVILHGTQTVTPASDLPTGMTGEAVFSVEVGGDYASTDAIFHSDGGWAPVPVDVVLENGDGIGAWSEIGRVSVDFVDRVGGLAKFVIPDASALAPKFRWRADATFEAFKGTMVFASGELLYNGDEVALDGFANYNVWEGTHCFGGSYSTISSFGHADLPKETAALEVPVDHRRSPMIGLILAIAPRPGAGSSFMHVNAVLEVTSEVDGEGAPINWADATGSLASSVGASDVAADGSLRATGFNVNANGLYRFYRVRFEEAEGSPGTDGTIDYAFTLFSPR